MLSLVQAYPDKVNVCQNDCHQLSPFHLSCELIQGHFVLGLVISKHIVYSQS